MTKQKQANKVVSDLFKDRKIYKQYLALAEWSKGDMPDRWKQTDLIKRGRASKNKFFFEVAKGGDEAITDFQVTKKTPGQFYEVQCSPKTGRTHQLRVQLSHKGFPILGDNVYGDKSSAPRLMLHAQKTKVQSLRRRNRSRKPRQFRIREIVCLRLHTKVANHQF